MISFETATLFKIQFYVALILGGTKVRIRGRLFQTYKESCRDTSGKPVVAFPELFILKNIRKKSFYYIKTRLDYF